MNCGEFRTLFADLLTGGEATDWPEKEYHRHLLDCQACRVLLAAEDVSDAVTTVASRRGASMEEMLLGEDGLKRAYRQLRISRFLRQVGATVAIGAALALAIMLWPREPGRAVHRAGPAEVSPVVAATPSTPKEFAERLATEEFTLRKGAAVRTTRALTFVFDRMDPSADQYEFVKKVALSGFEERLPDAPMAFISIVREDGQNLMGVCVDRSAINLLDPTVKRLPGPEFCRSFRVINDVDGRTRRADSEQN